jgi:glutathione S-transferase
MNDIYRLHFAPDNASLIVRLALDEMGLRYRTVLVDRARQKQRSPEYLALNPNGLIPVLETPQGPLFETGAILLWLSDTHERLAPAADARDRGAYLKWLFFVSNTLHTDLRTTFYPTAYVGTDQNAQDALTQKMRSRLITHLSHLDRISSEGPSWLNPDDPTGLCYYIACLLRWMTLYPKTANRDWFDIHKTPHLYALLAGLEQRPAVQAAQVAEGLGPTPFTSPRYATPPEGSAT